MAAVNVTPNEFVLNGDELVDARLGYVNVSEFGVSVPTTPFFGVDGLDVAVDLGAVSFVTSTILTVAGLDVVIDYGDPSFNEALPTAVDPVILDAAHSGLLTDPFTARVFLDPGNGNLTRIIIWAYYPASNLSELVYSGDGADQGGFDPAFSGKSTVTTLAAGNIQFSVIRNGNWTTPPRLFMHANSDLGGMTRGGG